MGVIERLDGERDRLNVLNHPFYIRWSRGGLSTAELASYAGQYRHLVLALAELSARAAASADGSLARDLQAHAEEESAHVGMWDRFTQATGGTRSPALPETLECAQAWTAADTLAEQLAVMYVIEASQPAISSTKLEGLAEHYGHPVDSPAGEYFRVHSLRDVEHAEDARELIEELVAEDDEALHERMLGRAREALQGNWRMLDALTPDLAAA